MELPLAIPEYPRAFFLFVKKKEGACNNAFIV